MTLVLLPGDPHRSSRWSSGASVEGVAGLFTATIDAALAELAETTANRRVALRLSIAIACIATLLLAWNILTFSPPEGGYSLENAPALSARSLPLLLVILVLDSVFAFCRGQTAQTNHIQERIFAAEQLKGMATVAMMMNDNEGLRQVLAKLAGLDPYPKTTNGELSELVRDRQAIGARLSLSVRRLLGKTATGR